MPYTLAALPYSFDAREPHIDARTMEVHHTKHHRTLSTISMPRLRTRSIRTCRLRRWWCKSIHCLNL
jgi:superoxide dismutase